MTWSMIARAERTGRIGIGVAPRFLDAGASVSNIKTGAGAVASQAFINPYFGSKGLALLDTGRSAEDVVAELIAADEGRHHRQLHVMDRQRAPPASTGAAMSCAGPSRSPAICWSARRPPRRPSVPPRGQ